MGGGGGLCDHWVNGWVEMGGQGQGEDSVQI